MVQHLDGTVTWQLLLPVGKASAKMGTNLLIHLADTCFSCFLLLHVYLPGLVLGNCQYFTVYKHMLGRKSAFGQTYCLFVWLVLKNKTTKHRENVWHVMCVCVYVRFFFFFPDGEGSRVFANRVPIVVQMLDSVNHFLHLTDLTPVKKMSKVLTDSD